MRMLLDSGAFSQCFYSRYIAEEHRLKVKPAAHGITLPDDKVASRVETDRP